MIFGADLPLVPRARHTAEAGTASPETLQTDSTQSVPGEAPFCHAVATAHAPCARSKPACPVDFDRDDEQLLKSGCCTAQGARRSYHPEDSFASS